MFKHIPDHAVIAYPNNIFFSWDCTSAQPHIEKIISLLEFWDHTRFSSMTICWVPKKLFEHAAVMPSVQNIIRETLQVLCYETNFAKRHSSCFLYLLFEFKLASYLVVVVMALSALSALTTA